MCIVVVQQSSIKKLGCSFNSSQQKDVNIESVECKQEEAYTLCSKGFGTVGTVFDFIFVTCILSIVSKKYYFKAQVSILTFVSKFWDFFKKHS